LPAIAHRTSIRHEESLAVKRSSLLLALLLASLALAADSPRTAIVPEGARVEKL
jgi:hypothetical protein